MQARATGTQCECDKLIAYHDLFGYHVVAHGFPSSTTRLYDSEATTRSARCFPFLCSAFSKQNLCNTMYTDTQMSDISSTSTITGSYISVSYRTLKDDKDDDSYNAGVGPVAAGS